MWKIKVTSFEAFYQRRDAVKRVTVTPLITRHENQRHAQRRSVLPTLPLRLLRILVLGGLYSGKKNCSKRVGAKVPWFQGADFRECPRRQWRGYLWNKRVSQNERSLECEETAVTQVTWSPTSSFTLSRSQNQRRYRASAERVWTSNIQISNCDSNPSSGI